MNISPMKIFIILMALLFVWSGSVEADRDRRDKKNPFQKRPIPENSREESNLIERPGPNVWVDKRFEHNRRYPRDGVVIKRLPERRHPIRYRDRSYFYIGGTWYLPSGPNFVVVRPPIGIIVPVLPAFYTTIWFGGVPYYYANDVYYVWRPDLNGYQVAEPPIEEEQQAPPLVADELFIYPKQGQSEEKQAEDRYACHRWGVEQTGYDPTQPPTGLPVAELSRLREDYQRAMKACLEGRGYSVR